MKWIMRKLKTLKNFLLKKPIEKPTPTPEVEPPKRDSPNNVKNYTPEQIEFELAHLYSSMREDVRGRQSLSHINWYMSKIEAGKDRYISASKKLQQQEGVFVPWEVIAVLHGMEGGFDFNKQMLNGQSWKKKSTIVPKGYGPWESWSDSTVTAFNIKETPENWNIGNTLYFCERFNGLGYRRKGKRTPYLWSYSNYQQVGKYVRDHVYDPTAVSLQVGVAIMLKRLGYVGYYADGKKIGG